jgi:hypothetical protein
MTSNKDLKRLVRTRMSKTGEAYTAARARIVRPPARPAPVEYAKLAGMSDPAIKAGTGRDWKAWTSALDAENANTLSHSALAKLIHTKFNGGSWWSQMVAVGYERIRGLRARGQQRNGSYSATKSKTFAVSAEQLFNAWEDTATRKRWIGISTRVRTAQPTKSMRLGMPDGAIIAVNFIAKGDGKSSVSVEQQKLPSREATDAFKKEWTRRFDALADLLKV